MQEHKHVSVYLLPHSNHHQEIPASTLFQASFETYYMKCTIYLKQRALIKLCYVVEHEAKLQESSLSSM